MPKPIYSYAALCARAAAQGLPKPPRRRTPKVDPHWRSYGYGEQYPRDYPEDAGLYDVQAVER